MEIVTYKVTFVETSDEWLFQYRKQDGIIYSFTNIRGVRILKLFQNQQFPENIDLIEQWTRLKHLVKVELVIEDYTFETFWLKYNLKVKKDKSQQAFEKLELIDRIKCFIKLPEYDAHLAKTHQAKAHMVTWINQKRYDDEY